MRRKLNKIRIALLKIITAAAIICFLLAACALDSEDFLTPFIVCLICTAWFGLMLIANKGEE